MSNLIENRHIRFFISSTFQDMHDERDYLMKHVFPELRIIAAKRNVTLTELDLRWGVTEEESRLGKVLGICLNEIENSIPFFIGIVGNRYGWCPTYNDVCKDVLERYNVVDSYLQRHLSITEMEMQYGVLERDEPMHAYFFIKDDQSKVDFEKAKELENLKNAIRNNTKGYPVLNYDTVETLGEFVKSYFIKLLDEVFPMKNISTIDKQHIIQRSIVNQLCQSYSANEFYFQFIDDWLLNNSEPVLVVFGESGMGKSALLANWIKRKENNHDEQSLFYHFIENTNNGTNYDAIQQTLCDGLCSKFGYKLLKSEEDNPLSSIFSRITTEGKSLVLVIDGLNQISNIANAKQLNWLPTPSGRIKILLSTIEEDKTFMTISRRHYQTLKLEPLTEDLKINLINNYLERYAKKLKPSQIIKIVKDPQCSNTLVLRTLLDELISFGVYEKIDERIAYYTGKKSIEDFYSALLYSYEDEYGHLLIREILSLIATSRYGLSEDEILSLTAIKPFLWSQFYCSFNRNFRSQNGLISFSNKSIYYAVETRYFSGNEETKYREILHDWFSCSYNEVRKMEEVPFQLYMIGDCDRLFLFLSEPINFVHLFLKDYNALQSYWNLLQKESSQKYPLTIYFKKQNKSMNDLFYGEVWHLAGFFISKTFFDHKLAIDYYKAALNVRLKIKGPLDVDTTDTYNNLATELLDLGFYEQSIEIYLIVLKLRRELFGELSEKVATTYNNIGTVYVNFDSAKSYDFLNKAKDIRLQLYGEKSYDVAISLNNIATIVLKQNNKPSFEELILAQKNVEKALAILYDLEGEDTETLATFMRNLSVIHDCKGELEESKNYLTQSFQIHRKLYVDNHPRIALDYIGIGYLKSRMGQYKEAFEYFQHGFRMYETIEEYISIDFANAHGHVAGVYYDLGNFTSSLFHFREQLKILEKLNLHNDIEHYYSILCQTYSNVGISYYKLDEQDNAIEFYNKAIDILKDVSEKYDVRGDYALYLNNLARAYFMKGDYATSLKLQNQSLDIQRNTFGENDQDTARSYNNIGLIYLRLENYNMAESYLQLALKIRKSLPLSDNIDIADSYKNIGDLFKKTKRFKDAITSYNKAYNIYNDKYGRYDKRCIELFKLLTICKLYTIL